MKPGRTVTPVSTPIAGNSVRSRSRLWAFGWLAMAFLVMAWVGVTWRLLSSPIDLRVPPYTPEEMVLVPRGRSSFMRPLAGTSSSAELSRVREDALEDPALTWPREDANPLPSFWIDRFEVTEGDYAVFLAAHPGRDPPRHWRDRRVPIPGDENLPVVNVSLNDAEAYAHWLGKRLPTAEEWGRAAEGERRGVTFPWGEDRTGIRANTLEASRGGRAPVGMFPHGASPSGVFDLVGNVAEWTVSRAPPWSRLGGEGDQAFVRGGSFTDRLLQPEYRTTIMATHAIEVVETGGGVVRVTRPLPYRLETVGTCANNVGFRCVMDTDAVDAKGRERARIAELIEALGVRDPLSIVTTAWPAQRKLIAIGSPALMPLRAVASRVADPGVRRRLDATIARIDVRGEP